MNRAIGRIFIVGMVLFAALMVNVVYLQVFAARGLQRNPDNHRSIAAGLRVKRGPIVAWDGTVIAASQKKSGFYYRTYPSGAFAPQTIGYDSVRYGLSGLESSYDAWLTGTSTVNGWQGLVDRALGRRPHGDTVRTTLVPAVQDVAQQALVGQHGAIVALDPTTGAVIAMASSPTYSPASLETQWRTLARDPSAPLFDRATQSLQPPGSSFKVVTATAGLGLGKVTPLTPFIDTGVYYVGGGKIVNYHHEVFGPNTLTRALTLSINTTFGKVGNLIGQGGLVDQMTAYGFYARPPLDLPPGQVAASGRYAGGRLLSPGAPMDALHVAAAAIGQENVLATPLQMALVAAGVADGGTVMRPYLVQDVKTPAGKVVVQAAPQQWQDAMSPQTAATLNTMMQQVVNAGTGTAAALSGIQVAGKTGTAEKPPANIGWFIAFAPAVAPKVAVAVMIENTPLTGGDVAAPLAAQVISAALTQQSLP